MKRVLPWSNTACCCPLSPWFVSRPSPCSAATSPPCSAPWPARSERPAEFYSLSHDRHRQEKVCVSGPDRGGLGGFERAVSHGRCGPARRVAGLPGRAAGDVHHPSPAVPATDSLSAFLRTPRLVPLVGVSAAAGDRRGRVEGLSSFEAGLLRRHG